MSAGWVLLLALLQSGPAPLQARWTCRPETVELGQPFELALEIEHGPEIPAGELLQGELALDDSWVLLAGPEQGPLRGPGVSGQAPGDGGRIGTRRVWRLASLEPGSRDLAPTLSSLALDARVGRISTAEAHVEVRGLLAADEDAPRPLRGFPSDFVPEDARRAAGAAWPLWGGLGALAAVLAAGLLRWRAARRVAPAEPGPLERLGELEQGLERVGAGPTCYELTRLLRRSADRLRARPAARASEAAPASSAGTAGEGLSDEEWLERLAASHDLPRAAVEELERLLHETSLVKYGGLNPTSWALQEIFRRARTVLESIGPGPRGVSTGPAPRSGAA